MGVVRIDVNGMCEVVRGLEQGIATVTEARGSLSTTLDRFGLDASRSWALQRAVDWARAELPGVRRRLALAQALEGSNPSWPAGTVQLAGDDDSRLPTMGPEAARAAGRELALSLAGRGGRLTEDELDLLELMQDDPYFASGFAGAVSPAELAGIVHGWSYARTPRDQCNDDAEYADRNAWYARAVTAVSTTLGTATRATGDLALPSGYARGWVETITAEVQSGLFPDGTGMAGHANALGLLLSSGRFSLSFLGAVADGVYDYERAFQEEYPGRVWAPRGGDPMYGPFVFDAQGRLFADPMAGVMAALGNNPAAAQNFFAGGDKVTVVIDGQELLVSDRLAYLICDRTWAIDPTNGGSLGEALVAATTMLRDRAGTGMTSAQIASQAFALIGEKSGPGGGGWQMWDGMVPHVAQMLSSYGTDVFRAIVLDTDHLEDGWAQRDDPGALALFPGGLAYGAVLDKALLERIVARIGADTTAVFVDENGRIVPGGAAPGGGAVTQTTSIEVLLAGLMVASQLRISTGLDRALVETPETAKVHLLTSSMSIPSIDNALIHSAQVLGWVVDRSFTGAMDEEKRIAARAKVFTDAVNAIMALPYLKLGEPLAQWALDQGRAAAMREIAAGAPVDATEAIKEIDAELPGVVSHMVMNLLLQAEYLEPEVFAAANAAAGGDR